MAFCPSVLGWLNYRTMIRRLACAISGGVDSAVSAYLLKKQGYHVTGVHMTNWDATNETGSCQGEQDIQDARFICHKLGIDLVFVNFVKEYWLDVFLPFLSDYEHGQTPNPDILCNRHIKFGHLLKHCQTWLGIDQLATGHYARTARSNVQGGTDKDVQLLVAKDVQKDQTLFLSQITQQALRCARFPLGHLLKRDVKSLAKQIGLDRIAAKKESMGICFIGKRNFKDFIGQYIPDRPGLFRDIDNPTRCLGNHLGIHRYTYGQRARLTIDQQPYFVCRKCSTTNDIFLAPGWWHPALFCQHLLCAPIHWICPSSVPNELSAFANATLNGDHSLGHVHPAWLHQQMSAISLHLHADCRRVDCVEQISAPFRCEFRFQHTHQKPIGCQVEALTTRRLLSNGLSDAVGMVASPTEVVPNSFTHVRLDLPMRSLTPGQYAVFYKNEQCLGSAKILHVGPSLMEMGFRTESDIGQRWPLLRLIAAEYA